MSVGILCMSASGALAQLDNTNPDQVGWENCFHSPRSVPGLSGLPQWPADGTTLPLPAGSTLRAEVSDPRWGNDPLRGFQFPSATDTARYRVVVSGNTLEVSIQVTDDDIATTWDDYVWFGIASADGSNAWAIKIPAYKRVTFGSDQAQTGSFLSPTEAQVLHMQYTGGAWTSDAGWPTGSPAWVDSASAAYWNDPAQAAVNGAVWAVQFKVDLTPLGLSASSARFTAGAVVTQTAGTVRYSTINRGACPDGACDPLQDGIVHPHPDEWTPLADLTGSCTGISVDRNRIYTGHPDGKNLVTPVPGETNTFIVEPDYTTSGASVDPGTLEARFRMSDWGTVADPQAGWVSLGQATNATFNEPQISYSCINEAGADNVCGVVHNTTGSSSSFHQCLQVELRPTFGHEVHFDTATAYSNTRFQHLSGLDETAVIDVKGLQAELGNANPRDIYLHVVKMNMPPAGATPMSMDTDSLDALRAQVDRWYAHTEGYCPDPGDTCIHGTCAYQCGPDPELPCGKDYEYDTDTGCYCIPNSGPVIGLAPSAATSGGTCTGNPPAAPAGGGVDPDTSALDGTQVLDAQYPTFMVYPYYDSGRTITVNGVQRPELIPMPTFGFHVQHDGVFYGFLSGLVNEDGSPLDEIAPDYYRITVPNEGSARVRVLISAEETPHYEPFSEVVGAATTFGHKLDTVALSGVTDECLPVDLGAATVTLNSVLAENGQDLVTNLGGPVTLHAVAGSTKNAAAYVNAGPPAVSMTAVNLPLVGQVTSIAIVGASVQRPSTCGWFGTAMLTTSFSFDDGHNAPVAIQGEDQWSCIPFKLIN